MHRLLHVLGLLFTTFVLINPLFAQDPDTVLATGPDLGSTLEDRVEIIWPGDSTLPVTSSFVITRAVSPSGSADLIGVVASTVTLFEDLMAVPGVLYEYCVSVRYSDNSESPVGCNDGTRVIARPTGFLASDGLFEDDVRLTWSDRSEIEGGYNIYRDAGNAIDLDGVDDYVSVAGVTNLPPSFTVEFWASRRSFSGEQFVVNLENSPQGSPTTEDLEIGFNNIGEFVVAFGSDELTAPSGVNNSDWHHWAVSYDGSSRTRTLYRDGIEIGADVYPQVFQSSGDLEFGRRSTIGNRNRRGHFDGLVDEVRLWDIDLDDEELQSLMTTLLSGNEGFLVSQWPMDVNIGTGVPDVAGTLSGILHDPNSDGSDWSPSDVADYRTETGPDLTVYSDRTAVPAFQSYSYRLAAFEDVDGNGFFTPGTDFESEQRSDSGWRAALSPPANVSATDGQFLDRVRITWVDQSESETSFRIYRDDAFIGSVAADSKLFDDMTATTTHEYCVAASNGVESIRVCDFGMSGNLPAPDSVLATNGTFDDRVQISWLDTTDTEDGFEVFRDGVLLATTGLNAEEYNDFSAAQDSSYAYCVRAFSEFDPDNPSYSSLVCSPEMGLRAAVLAPENVAATDNEFEERVDLSWTSPSATAMVFKVYRDNTLDSTIVSDTSLIEILDFNMTRTTDFEIMSDTPYEYCVTAETVIGPGNSAAAGQAVAAQVLEGVRHTNAVRSEMGQPTTDAETALNMVYEALGLGQLAKTGSAAGGRLAESEFVCDAGGRLLAAPTDVDATDNEFENHVQINWVDVSDFEKGYHVLRQPGGGVPMPLDTLSANRTTYGDYTGVPGTQYNYIVRAFDDYDTSDPDSDFGKRTLEPPTGMQASDGISEMVVEIEWRDNSSAEKGYNIYRRPVGAADSTLAGSTGRDEPAFTDVVPDAMLGVEFEYIVTAFDDYGESLRATDRGKTVIEAPANVNASEVYDDRTVLIWVDRSEIEDGYRLTRRELGTGAGIGLDILLPAGTTMYTDNDGSAGRDYEYCVSAALQSNGNTIYSTPQCDVGSKFQLGGGGPPPGVLAVKLAPYRQPSRYDLFIGFGNAVALDGMNALAGGPGIDRQSTGIFGLTDDESSGLVHRYSFTDQNLWTAIETWPRPDGGGLFDPESPDVDFGYSLDFDDPYAIVGDPAVLLPQVGTFNIWKKQPVSGIWQEVIKKTEVSATGENSGISVALADSFAIIGNSLRSTGVPSGHGSAVLCNIEAALRDGTDCGREDGVPQFELVLDAQNRVADAAFGQAVDVTRIADSLYAIVGAPGDDRAYIFKCDLATTTCGSTANWSVLSVLNTRFRQNNEFGAAVAISPKLALVGAPGAGGIAVYEFIDGAFAELKVFTPQTNADGFGTSMAINDTTIIVGAPNEEVGEYENAGAVYVYDWDSASSELINEVRYDARVASVLPGRDGKVQAEALFGHSVDLNDDFYLVGAPRDDNDLFLFRFFTGAIYSIPVGLEPPESLILPPGVDLAIPGDIRASDGTAPDRIQIRWDDESDDEDGHTVFRSNPTGEIEELAEVSPNIEFFDDFEAAPGEAYTYCVAAFYAGTYTDMNCDIGWRPPNGTIAGRLAARQGGGTEEAQVCLAPSPNRSLLFDGHGGFVSVPLGEDNLDLVNNFTIEAWIRPHAVDGLRYIVSKDTAYSLALNEGRIRFELVGSGSVEADAPTALSLGDWHHVAASFSGVVSPQVSLYLDGVKIKQEGGLSPGSLIGDSLSIGQLGGVAPEGYFKGEVDEVRIWDVALADSLIETRRFSPLSGEEENLVGYWPLDQGKRRVAPDLSETAVHGNLVNGVYLADEGGPLDVCDITTSEGNYSISDIRYGESTEFNVIPMREDREFEPSFKKITLTVESPAQNEVTFIDATAYAVSGSVEYVDVVGSETFTCPAPDIDIHVGKGNLANDDNAKLKTGADGGFVVAVDPSVDNQDFWYVIPQYIDPENDELVHTFAPANAELLVTEDTPDVNFNDLRRHTLSGHFSGGDPATCGKDIGTATIRLYTQDGCYDRMFTVDSADPDTGAFDFELPPFEYLMEVVDIEMDHLPAARQEEINQFFADLGTVEVDLTGGDAERNLIYRAPLILTVEGLEPQMCPGDVISELDEERNLLRTLPEVATIGEYEFVPLTISVAEDYGNGEFCPVDEGQVAIFDAIADRVDVDTTMQLENGVVQYTTFGASPNIFSGARIQGVDRSYQKPITVVAQVEGRDFLTETQWALVEGFRERSATFVSATTEEFPLMILHDPPGSESFAFLEEGSTHCTRISSTKLSGGGAGALIDIVIGFKARTGASGFGFHFTSEFGGGLLLQTRTVAGRNNGSLWDENGNDREDDNIEICMTTTEALSTSSDPTWVGEDIHVGVALNLIFAIADVLTYDPAACTVNLSETLAADLDESEPFETTYAFGTSHIALSLIPELENLIKLAGGDATVEGEIDGQETRIGLEQALDNWKKQLENNENLQAEALGSPDINRSFSGGTEFSYSEANDTTEVTRFESKHIYVNSESAIGAAITAGAYDQILALAFEVNAEWMHEEEDTESESRTIGYTLKDGDTGDYFSVDIAKDPRYMTHVFKTLSGRSSNPHEANTQKRDNPIIMVDPPVLFNVDPEGAGSFDLTLINGSESDERRRYTLAVPGEKNPRNLGITVTGDLLGGNRLESFLIDPGKAMTINMDVFPAPSAYAYPRVGIVFYPEDEFNIWLADVRQPFALADTAFFSVYFDSTGGGAMAAPMAEGWTWFSLNREGGDVNTVLDRIPAHEGDILRGQDGESRFDSTAGWTGELTQLVPGAGYRIKLQESTVFRVVGDPVESPEPIELESGWNWIGYLPAKRLPINVALESLEDQVREGDLIVGQTAFANYVEGVGWVGTLREMVPGQSYALNLTTKAKLQYPGEVEDVTWPSFGPRERTIMGPEWEIAPERFDESRTMVAEVKLNGQTLEQTTTKVAVFAGDSLRGMGEVHYVEDLDKYLAFVMIYRDLSEEEVPLRVHAYDGENDMVYEDVGTIHYSKQEMLGHPVSPVVLELSAAGEAPELLDVPEEFKLYANYPNPFNPTTTIAYDLADASNVKLVVYDVLGREVTTLVDNDQRAGRYKIVFDATRLASGFYVYRLEANDFSEVHKMILVK